MPDDSKAEINRRIESCSNFDRISTYMVEVHKEERVKKRKYLTEKYYGHKSSVCM